jgi:hypothetical protein
MSDSRTTAHLAWGRAPFGRSRLGRWLEEFTARVVRQIYRLKRHRSPWVRRGLGMALVAGGLLAFLPVLGIWMLPLGLVVLSDEVHQLRRPRRRFQVWAGSRWPLCRLPLPDAA